MQSGSALNQWAINNRDNTIDRAFRLGKALGCDTKDTNKLLQFLREVPVNDFLTTATRVLTADEILSGLSLLFVPCVEVPATSRSFLPALPIELLKQGTFAKVPTIIGSTSAEGMISFAIFNLSEDNTANEYERFQKFILQDMGLSVGSDEAKQISKEFKQFYFGDEPVTVEKLDSFFELYGDVLFDYGIDKGLRLMVETEEAAPVYAYEFTHCLSNSWVKTLMQTMKPGANFKGVSHGEDISFFFNHAVEGVKKPSATDEEFIAKVTKMWATFAKTGNPNYSGIDTEWGPVKKNSFCHLDIGKEFKLVPERVKQQRLEKWQQLYDKYPRMQ